MIRTLITIAFASFILAVACLAGAAALGGRDIAQNGWTIPSEWQYRIADRHGRSRVERVRRTISTVKPFTVACVPTGMKAGSWTSPRAVVNVLRRAPQPGSVRRS